MSSYQQASEVFQRIGRRHIPPASIWRQVAEHEKRLQDYVERQQLHVGLERVKLPAAGCDRSRRKGVSLEGFQSRCGL